MKSPVVEIPTLTPLVEGSSSLSGATRQWQVLLGGSNALFLVRILAKDFDNRAETVVTSAALVSIRLALSRLVRVNSTNPGQQCTMAKVRKSDGEETFVGRRSNDEDAP